MTTESILINQLTAAVYESTVSQTEKSSDESFSEVLKSASGGTADLDAIFEAAARKYNVPVNLLKSVAKAESNFRADATSKCGAMGIMQLMPGTAKSLGVTDAYDPEQNIMGGAKYLSQMLDKFDGDVSLALAAYNAGPGNVSKYGGIPPFNETQNYVKKVMGYLGEGGITAGSVTYKGSAAAAGARASYLNRDTGIEAESDGTLLLGESMKEMLLIKIIEMQMKSSDDEKDHKVF